MFFSLPRLARAQNSRKGRSDELAEVPNRQGVLPSQSQPPLDYPETLAHLLVAGNEGLSDVLPLARWNKTKSKKLLDFYGVGDNSDSENEDEGQAELNGRSRRRRLRVAEQIGVTKAQLNFASMFF